MVLANPILPPLKISLLGYLKGACMWVVTTRIMGY